MSNIYVQVEKNNNVGKAVSCFVINTSSKEKLIMTDDKFFPVWVSLPVADVHERV